MCTPLWRGTMAVYRFLASAQIKRIVIIIYDNNAIKLYNNKGLRKQ